MEKSHLPPVDLPPPPPIDMSASREKSVLVFCLLLVAATLAFYNPIIHNQFSGFDDWNYILKNPHVQSGLTWETVKWSFTAVQIGMWHPLTWLSHALDCQLFHLNPVGHHYTSVLFHAANAVLLFLLLRRATGSPWSSLLVAALFALHPVNVESVAWAAERKTVLSTMFFLLALYVYDRHARAGGRPGYWPVAALFALGLLAKPQIITLPFVLLLWDYWPLQRMGAGSMASGDLAVPAPRSFYFLVREKLPLFALAAADAVATVIAQRAGNAVRTISEVSLRDRLGNVFVSYVRYLGKAFWPSRLAPMYPRNPLPLWQVAGSVVLLSLLSVLVLRWRERRYLVAGWLWFLGTLAPMIGIVAVGDQAMADRYAYISFIGLFVAVVWSVQAWSVKVGAMDSEPGIAAAGLGAAAVAGLLILGSLTSRQIRYWRDDDTLWRYTLTVTERNYVAHNNLALMLAAAGRSDEAVAEFRLAKSMHQYPPDQVLRLAGYELRVNHPLEAIEECDSVVRSSNDARLQATAWIGTGQAQMQLQRYEQAEQAYQNALRLTPENSAALIGAGVLAMRQRQSGVAIPQLAHAVKVDPSDVNLLLLAQALREDGRSADANSAIAQAQKISRDFSQAQIAAGQFLSLAGLKPR